MWYKKVIVKRLPAAAMALYPFMLFKKDGLSTNEVLIRHEKIHFRQQLELLILPFYILYGCHYLYNLLKYQNHQSAYQHICFEREAYAHDANSKYLEHRPFFAWLKFLKR